VGVLKYEGDNIQHNPQNNTRYSNARLGTVESGEANHIWPIRGRLGQEEGQHTT